MSSLVDQLRSFLRRPAVPLAILAVVCAVLLAQTYSRAYRPQGYDLTSYLLSARAVWEGDNPYQTAARYPYIYPLFLATLMIPLALVPYGAAVAIWFALNAAALIGSFLALARVGQREIGLSMGWHLAWPMLAILLVLFSPVQNCLLNGQVNPIVVFFCAMFLREFARGREAACAAWLAAAVAVKLLPVVLLGFVLIRRRWRVLLWTPAFLLLFFLLPWPFAGADFWTLNRNYAEAFLLPSLGNPGEHSKGMFFGLFGAIKYVWPEAVDHLWPKLAGLAAAAGAVLAVEAAVWRGEPSRRDLWPFCAYLVGCLLASPIAETHHLLFAAPAVLLVGLKLMLDRAWAGKHVWAWAALFLVCFDVLGKMFKTSPFYFLSLVALVVLLWLAARSTGPEERTSPCRPTPLP